jgi:hypothetical protein
MSKLTPLCCRHLKMGLLSNSNSNSINYNHNSSSSSSNNNYNNISSNHHPGFQRGTTQFKKTFRYQQPLGILQSELLPHLQSLNLLQAALDCRGWTHLLYQLRYVLLKSRHKLSLAIPLLQSQAIRLDFLMQYNAQTRRFTGMHLLSKTNKLSLIIESSQHLVVVD